MKLYDLKHGVNPKRVKIFLAEKSIEVPVAEEFQIQEGKHLEPEFRAINPAALLPVLETDDGHHISESIAICRYIDALHPEPPMFGRTPLEKGQVEMWNRRIEHEIMVPMLSVFRHSSPLFAPRGPQFPEYGQAQGEVAVKNLAWVDAALAEREFIVGDIYTVADITLQVTLAAAKGFKIEWKPSAPRVAEWYDRVKARPSARA